MTTRRKTTLNCRSRLQQAETMMERGRGRVRLLRPALSRRRLRQGGASPGLARQGVCHTGSLSGADRAELARIPDLAERRLAQLLALAALPERSPSSPLLCGEPFCCSEDVGRAYGPRLAGEKQDLPANKEYEHRLDDTVSVWRSARPTPPR